MVVLLVSPFYYSKEYFYRVVKRQYAGRKKTKIPIE
jgi:hypothetical protein